MANLLAKFSKLNRNTFLFKSQAPQINSPISLVILCTWVGARPKHIEKYTEKYQTIYPAAEIMILASSIADMSYRSNKSQRDALQPAREAVLSHISATKNSVLLHAFSNGGAQCAVQLAASLSVPDRERAFNAIILDSCPGIGSYQRSALAMKLSLPRGFIQYAIGLVLIHLTLMALFFCDRVLGIENAVSSARRRLLYPTIFPTHVPRLYVYSKKDDMVPDGDVHEHAEEARQYGYQDVKEVVFEESKHCAHAGRYGEEYWGAVEEVVRG